MPQFDAKGVLNSHLSVALDELLTTARRLGFHLDAGMIILYDERVPTNCFVADNNVTASEALEAARVVLEKVGRL